MLFCDLVDSTELASRCDPEEFRDLLDAYHAAGSEAIGRQDGHVAQYLGDGILAYFGYPRAYEDSAERAVSAGIAIQEALQGVNATPVVRRGIEIRARVGIHTGPVVVSEVGRGERRETLALGNVTNVAARIQALAEPGTVVVTEATGRLIDRSFELDDRGAHELKGLPAPVSVLQVRRRLLRSGSGRAGAPRLSTPFVGRKLELGMLLDHWGRASHGRGQVVLISGEPGIGKSRLLERFRTELEEVPHLWAECAGSRSGRHTPFGLLIDMADRALGWHELSAGLRLQRLEEGLRAIGVAPEEGIPLLASLFGLATNDRFPPLLVSADQHRKRLIEFVVTGICRLARERPLALALEDVQWADPSTLEALALLVERTATAPILLLLTGRRDFVAPWPARDHHTELSLTRLSAGDVHEIFGHWRTSARLAPEVFEAFVARSDGVPLFAEELARTLVELEGEPALDAIPVTLHDSLQARLDRLGPARELAQLAAVLGREFSHSLLRAVTGLSENELQRHLTNVIGAELFDVTGLPPKATYRFRHALLQQAAYDSLLKARRRQLHARVAKILADRAGNGSETPPEVIAQHWTAAGEAQRAVDAWEEGGNRAFARSAYAEAITHYSMAIEVLAELPDGFERARRELELELRRGSVFQMEKGFAVPEFVASLERARKLSLQLGDVADSVPTLMGIWSLSMNRGEVRAAHGLAEQILRATQSHGDDTGVRWAQAALAGARVNLGDFSGALESASRALDFDAPEDFALPIRQFTTTQALLYSALAAAQLGRIDQAHARCQELLEFGERRDEGGLDLPLALNSCLVVLSWLRLLDRVSEIALRLHHLASDRQLPLFASWAGIYGGWADALRGQPERGIPRLHQGLEDHVRIGQRLGLAQYLGLLAEARLHGGNVESGLETINDAIQVDSEELWYQAELLRVRADLQNAAGTDADTVEGSYRDAVRLAQRTGAKLLELRSTTSLARLLTSRHRGREARSLLAPLYASFTEGFDLPDLRLVAELLNRLAERTTPSS